MRQITTVHLQGLLADQESPCMSFYMPTHRQHPENQQDPIRYRNLLRELESSLRQKYPTRNVRSLLDKFGPLARDDRFWNHRTDGLAILASPAMFQIFELQRPVPELLVVADSFHIKPLLRVLQSADRYQVLALNRHEVKLYEGNRDALDEIDLAEGVPGTIEEALGDELTEPHVTVASYGGVSPRSGARGVPSMHHGHGQRKDEVDLDNERFFRAVDRAILEHHSRPSKLPLILAALPEHHGPFRTVSHNPFLLDVGIDRDPGSVSIEQLRRDAWEKLEPNYLERLAGLVDAFHQARAQHLASADMTDVGQALAARRVGTLLVEANRQIPGKLDPASGRVEFGDLAQPGVDDLLDDFAELTLKSGGDVVVVPAERMPVDSGLAATFRF